MSKAPLALRLAWEILNDQTALLYVDNTAYIIIGIPVVDYRFGIFLTLEKGRGEIYGLPAISSVKVSLRKIENRNPDKDVKPWGWPHGSMSNTNIRHQRHRNPICKALYDELATWDVLYMVDDYYAPLPEKPTNVATALMVTKKRYEEILTALTFATMTGISWPKDE